MAIHHEPFLPACFFSFSFTLFYRVSLHWPCEVINKYGDTRMNQWRFITRHLFRCRRFSGTIAIFYKNGPKERHVHRHRTVNNSCGYQTFSLKTSTHINPTLDRTTSCSPQNRILPSFTCVFSPELSRVRTHCSLRKPKHRLLFFFNLAFFSCFFHNFHLEIVFRLVDVDTEGSPHFVRLTLSADAQVWKHGSNYSIRKLHHFDVPACHRIFLKSGNSLLSINQLITALSSSHPIMPYLMILCGETETLIEYELPAITGRVCSSKLQLTFGSFVSFLRFAAGFPRDSTTDVGRSRRDGGPRVRATARSSWAPSPLAQERPSSWTGPRPGRRFRPVSHTWTAFYLIS